jgi:ribose transport system substrate-binding protein
MVQRPVTMGSLAVDHLVAQIQGTDTSPPKDIDTGVTVVTKDNVGTYTK